MMSACRGRAGPAGRSRSRSASGHPQVRASSRRRWLISSAGVPVWTICPRLSTCTRSATESASGQVLLHQQDRQPAPLELRDHPAHLAHQQRAPGPRSARPSAAGSGLDMSARPIASICCSPPESLLARLPAALAQPRKQSIHLLEAPSPRAAAGHLEVLAHAQRREHAPALRHQGHAQRHHAERRQPRDLGVLVAHARRRAAA